MVVLSYAEIPDDQSIQVIHTVSAENQQAWAPGIALTPP
jgi:hypothetical protein